MKSYQRIIAVILAMLILWTFTGCDDAVTSSSSSASSDSDSDDTQDAESESESESSSDSEGDENEDEAETSLYAIVSPGSDEDETEAEESSSEESDEKTLIAEEYAGSESASGSVPDASSNQFQSLDAFVDNKLSFGGPSSSGNFIVYNLSGSIDDFDVIEEYVELLDESMNFDIIDSYYKSYDSGSAFFSFALDYVGEASVDADLEMQYVDGVSCDVSIWGTIEDNEDLDVRMWVPLTLEAVDMGWRSGGSVEDISPSGDSVYAGLYKLSDGSYETTDSRLATTLGSAYILMDGEEIISDAEYTITGDKEVLEINSFYRTESVYFTVEYNQLLSGDIYTFEDLRGDYGTMERYNDDPHDFIMGTAFAVYHDGNWRYPLYENSIIEELSVRVMYYEKDVEAVFYIYVTFETSPFEIEILAAVDLSSAQEEEESSSEPEDSSESQCSYCFGTGECSSCDGKGYNLRWRGGEQTEVICASCVGSGKCTYCGGDGYR